jgi:hypothetical protein
VAINRVLQRSGLTHRLILQIEAAHPELAQECAPLALNAIVEAGDFALAYRYTSEPLKVLEEESRHLNESIATLESEPPSPAPRFAAYVHIYCESVRLLCAILRGVNEADAAVQLEEKAVELVDSPKARDAVRQRLRETPGEEKD